VGEAAVVPQRGMRLKPDSGAKHHAAPSDSSPSLRRPAPVPWCHMLGGGVRRLRRSSGSAIKRRPREAARRGAEAAARAVRRAQAWRMRKKMPTAGTHPRLYPCQLSQLLFSRAAYDSGEECCLCRPYAAPEAMPAARAAGAAHEFLQQCRAKVGAAPESEAIRAPGGGSAAARTK